MHRQGAPEILNDEGGHEGELCDPDDPDSYPEDHKCWPFAKQGLDYAMPPCDPDAGNDDCPYPSICMGDTVGASWCWTSCAELVDAGYLE